MYSFTIAQNKSTNCRIYTKTQYSNWNSSWIEQFSVLVLVPVVLSTQEKKALINNNKLLDRYSTSTLDA